MNGGADFIQGEFRRSLDDRYRLSIPGELADPLTRNSDACNLAKEQPGCLSLWNAPAWRDRLDSGVQVVHSKMLSGRLAGRLDEVQVLGRLLSSRHKEVQLTGRGRLLIPEGFREFLGVEPGGAVMVVGAAVCIEIWHPDQWLEDLRHRMPQFGKLLDDLAN